MPIYAGVSDYRANQTGADCRVTLLCCPDILQDSSEPLQEPNIAKTSQQTILGHWEGSQQALLLVGRVTMNLRHQMPCWLLNSEQHGIEKVTMILGSIPLKSRSKLLLELQHKGHLDTSHRHFRHIVFITLLHVWPRTHRGDGQRVDVPM